MVENKDRKCDHGHLLPVVRKSGEKHQVNGTGVGWGDQGGSACWDRTPEPLVQLVTRVSPAKKEIQHSP